MNKQKFDKTIGVFIGTISEYYDYSLYAFSANIIAQKFFAQNNEFENLIKVFAIYSFAYFAKPIGSIIFGVIGDKYGRKVSLNITIIGILIPTVIIGITPEYSQIGVLSTIILVLCRLLQSIFVAGEYDGAAIYVIEHLGAKYNYTASSITRCSGVIGLILGIAASNFFSAHFFPEWSWRIPFLLSVPLSFVVLYYRRMLDETPVFKEHIERKNIKDSHISLPSLVSKHRWQLLQIILLAGGFGATYNIGIIFMKYYLPIVSYNMSFIINSFSILIVVCFGVSMPIAGYIADKFGVLFVVKVSLFLVLISSILFIIGAKHNMINLIIGSCLVLSVFLAPFNALAHAVVVKSCAIDIRYRSISIGHAIGSVLISGSANFVCSKVMQVFDFTIFPILYIVFFSIVSYCMIHLLNKQSYK
ncbi:MAG: MFS transporter [Rickettsiaceae bacterium]